MSPIKGNKYSKQNIVTSRLLDNFDSPVLFSIIQTDDGYVFKSHYNTHKDNYINISREIHTISDYQQAGKELTNQIACSIMSYSSEIATELYSMITCLSI